MEEKLFLIDAMAMIYRAYFALISNPMLTKSGKNVSAVYGFTNSLVKILEERNPEHIAVCFDTEAPTFRHKEYPKYKAQRQEIPTDMPWQIAKVKEVVKALSIPCIEIDGYEADDVIGTLVKQAEFENVISYIVTPDKDFMQLVNDKVFLYKPAKTISEVDIIGIDEVVKRFGVKPSMVTEVLGLMGDASDNIPGVRGVGEKTAIALIQQYGSIRNIYDRIDEITKPKLKENLIQYKEDAFQAKRLVTILTDVPLAENFHNLVRKPVISDKLIPLLEELEFKSILRKYSTYKIGEEKPQEDRKKKSGEIKISIRGEKIEKEEKKQEIPGTQKKFQTLKDIKHNYYTIKNPDQYIRLINQLSKQELISFDTETDGLNCFQAKLVGFSFSYNENEAFYVPIIGKYTEENSGTGLFDNKKNESGESGTGVEINFALEKLKPLLENKNIRKVGQNIKFDYMIMKNHNIKIENIYFDTMVASYILNPEGQHDMNTLAEKYLSYRPVRIEELIGKGKSQITMDKVPVDKVSEYAAEDADVTLKLYYRLKFELQKINLYKLCTEIEFPLIEVLAEMELLGIKIDKRILQVIDTEITEYITDTENKIYSLAGEKFNINSTKKLSYILFEKLKLLPTKKTKMGFSTDTSVLDELKYQHEIASQLIEYRTLTKLKSTYINGLSEAINPKTGRVHTSFSQTVTSTGRLASTNPNLQNIPIRTPAGKSIRKAFVSDKPDFLIMSADYSQIELRIMAHFADDENLIDAFKHSRDIHAETAMRIFGIDNKKDVTDGMRRKAKEVNFGIMYGIGAFGLANRLEIKNSEAKDIIERYFKEFPKVKEYMENTKIFARENGYVQTLKGRRRYLSQINNQNASARAEDERAAINMPIQGTAADMIKIAMINIHKEFIKKNLESKMLLQVHDELIFEINESEENTVKKIVLKEMKNAIPLKVPVEVEIKSGHSWFSAHKQ